MPSEPGAKAPGAASQLATFIREVQTLPATSLTKHKVGLNVSLASVNRSPLRCKSRA